jgi:predicted NBD/HSP70 family sugar kinase
MRIGGMTMGRLLVGVDLGGTNVRIGIVSPKGRVLKKEEYPLDLSQGG